MPPTLQENYEQLGKLNHQAREIIEAADQAGRDLTDEESAKVDEIYAEYDKTKEEVHKTEANEKRRKRLEEQEQFLNEGPGRLSEPNPVGGRGGATAYGEDGGEPMVLEFRGRQITFPANSYEALRDTRAYHEAFGQYLAMGDYGIRGDLQVAKDPKGGYLAPTRTAMELIKFLDDEVFMRQLCRVLPPLTSAASLGVPSLDTDPSDADWTSEVPSSNMGEDTSMKFGSRELMPHLLSKLVKISMKLLRIGVMNPEQLVRERLGYKFSVTEEKGFLTGNGAQQPLGIFTASSDGISTSRDSTSGTSGDFDEDDLMDAFYQLKGQYQRNATWVCHRDFVKKTRKLKDSNGQYIWQPGLRAGEPDTILSRPFRQSEFAPNTFSSGKYVAVVGDFRTGYWIVDSLQMEIQRLNELFARTNEVGMIGRKETDGQPVLEEAFSRLKLQ